MRITVVDRSTFMVMEVIEFSDGRELNQYRDWLGGYSHKVYAWFVSVKGLQPEHANHNAHGQLITRRGKPVQAWTA